MAFTVLTDDPSAREVGDLIIVDDRPGYVDVLGLLNQNFVNKTGGGEGTDETEPGNRADTGEEAEDDEAEDDQADEEAEDDDTESERS